MNRRWSLLSALLATALLLWCMPGLFYRHLSHTGRTDDSLKPERSRVLVVWVTSRLEEDRKLIPALCAAFEKENPAIRVYLRFADSSELFAPGAVRPDVLLHTTGDVLSPAEVLLPLVSEAALWDSSSGTSAGTLYGLPLWYSPLVFSVPAAWVAEGDELIPQGEAGEQAYFAAATPAPDETENAFSFDSFPWYKQVDRGCLVAENGVGLTRLLLCCPSTVQQELRSLAPALRKPENGEAAVCSMAVHQQRKDAVCLQLLPPTAQQARYVSLCKQNADGQAFLHFLRSEIAVSAVQETGLVPLSTTGTTPPPFLPNAFQMAQANIDELCIQHFLAGDDPVSTLLRLR